MRNSPPSPPRRVRGAHESKSATVRAAAAAPSRRQQSHWKREQSQQRTLYLAIGVLVVVVLGIFAGGLVYDNVVRANQVVAQVGPDSIIASQLLDEIRPLSAALDAQAKQLGNSSNSSNIASYVDQQKRSMPDQVLNSLVDQRLIEQEAARRGISVSSTELDDKERQTVADFQASTNPAPTPEPSPTADTAATSTDTAAAASPTPAAATTPTAVPTLDTSAYGPALQQFLDKNFTTEAELRTQLNRSLLRDKLQTAIGQEQVPDVQEQVHVQQLVVTSQAQANDLLSQLQNGGDFAQLAQQFSTDTATKAKGGDMGWITRGSQTKTIEDAAFALQPGQLSDVIQDGTNYRILQVTERDPARPVAADQLTTMRSTAFNTWLSTQRSGPSVKLSLDTSEKDWLLSKLGIRP